MLQVALALALLWASPAYADLTAKVGTFSITTGTSDVVVSDVGFTPKAIIFWWSGRTEAVDTVGRATHNRGIGYTAGTSDNHLITSNSVDAQTGSQTRKGFRTDAAIGQIGTDDTWTHASAGYATLASFDSGAGFTLTITDAFSTNFKVSYLALGGDELENADTCTFDGPGGTGSQSITSFAFQPDFVLFISARISGTPALAAVDSTINFGMASGPSNEWSWLGGLNDGDATMQSIRHMISSRSLISASATVTTTNINAGEFTQFTANGFDINWTTAGATMDWGCLGLRTGGNVKVGNALTQTDTSTTFGTGALGFTPVAMLAVSHNTAEAGAILTAVDHDYLSIGGATSASARVAQAMRDEDAAADSTVTTAIEYDAIYAQVDATGIVGLGDVSAWGADSVDLIMDDNDPAQSFLGYVVIGKDTVAAGAAADALLLNLLRGL